MIGTYIRIIVEVLTIMALVCGIIAIGFGAGYATGNAFVCALTTAIGVTVAYFLMPYKAHCHRWRRELYIAENAFIKSRKDIYSKELNKGTNDEHTS